MFVAAIRVCEHQIFPEWTRCGSDERKCWQLHRRRSTRRFADVLSVFSGDRKLFRHSSCSSSSTT